MVHHTGNLYLVRHAQSQFVTKECTEVDASISPKVGDTQARQMAEFVGKLIGKLCIGYVSPYLRCIETAQAILGRADISFVVEPKIREAPIYLSNQELRIYPKPGLYPRMDWRCSTYWVFKNESLENYFKDLREFISVIPNETVIVSHPLTIMTIIRLITGTEEKLTINSASVSYIKDGKIQFTNNTSFLKDDFT